MPISLDATRRRAVPRLAAFLALLAAAPALGAQASADSSGGPTIRAESNGEVRLSTGNAPSFTITTSCPAEGSGSRCLLWIEPASDGVMSQPRVVQWSVTKTAGACGGVETSVFRDVTADPGKPLAAVAKGASCALTLAFRLAGESATSADVVRNVSLYVTTPD